MRGQTVEYWVSTVLPLTLLIKPPLIHINIPASAEINPLNHLSQYGDQRCYVGGEKQTEMTQLLNSLGHTTISGTRPNFPSRRAKISCRQWPGKKIQEKRCYFLMLNNQRIIIFRVGSVQSLLPGCLTMSAKHPVLCFKREGNTCGFQFLHEGLV